MNKITLMGLGAMGTAIGRSLLENKCDLTVWNRTPEKTRPLIEVGANSTSSLKDAITSSQFLIICIHGYSATRENLDHPEIRTLLKDRTIIQMSTGTPREAQEAKSWFDQLGANYLDCAIEMYPENVGKPSSQIVVCGPQRVFNACEQIINILAEDTRYLGENIRAAAAMDLAVMSRLTAITLGVIYGALICDSEGISMDQYANMYPVGDRARSLATTIYNDCYDKNIAVSVSTAMGCVASIKQHALEQGLNSELSDLLLDVYERAVCTGYRDHDAASLFKVLGG